MLASQGGGSGLKIEHLAEFIAAAHLSQQVVGPYEDRGGVMLVADPGQMKTSVTNLVAQYPNARVMSDVNVVELSNLRNSLVSNTYRTIVFQEMQKLYDRGRDTSKNIEGVLRAITAEGWQGLPHESQMSGMPGKAFVIGCVTPMLYKRKGIDWRHTGFTRRFLWLQYAIDNIESQWAAQDAWEKLNISCLKIPWPTHKLNHTNTVRENQWLRDMLHEQPSSDHSIQHQILVRTYVVLKWHYQSIDDGVPVQIMTGIASLLKQQGGQVKLPSPPLELVRTDEPLPKRPRKASVKRVTA